MTALNIVAWYALVGYVFAAWVFHWTEQDLNDAAGVAVFILIAAAWPIAVLILAFWYMLPTDPEGNYAADHDDF